MEGDQRQSVEYWILEPPYEVPRKVAEVDGDLTPPGQHGLIPATRSLLSR